MMLGLAGAISKKLRDIGKSSSKPTISWDTSAPTKIRVVHRDPVSGRPSSLPLAHRVSLMDENLVVQLGFRTRPLESYRHHYDGHPVWLNLGPRSRSNTLRARFPRRSGCLFPVVRNTTPSQIVFSTRLGN